MRFTGPSRPGPLARSIPTVRLKQQSNCGKNKKRKPKKKEKGKGPQSDSRKFLPATPRRQTARPNRLLQLLVLRRRTAYRAPPRSSHFSGRHGAHLRTVSLCCGSSSSHPWPCRRWSHAAPTAVAQRRRPPRRLRHGSVRVVCAHPAGAEAITACSWNEYVICSDVPVLIVFWASWCGPCKMVNRLVEEIAQEYAGKIKCYKLDTDDYRQVATSNKIERIPTVLLFKDGEKLEGIIGTLPKSAYVKAIEKSLS